MTKTAAQKAKSAANAFGDPEGQRSTIDDDFVPFHQGRGWGDLSTEDDSFEARLLIGRKGSGKTLYMRRLHASAVRSGACYATEIEYQPPDTETVHTFSRHFTGEGSQLEWWTKLWSRCVLRSVASHLGAGRLPNAEKMKEKLKPFAEPANGRLIRNFLEPLSACRQMDEIAVEHQGRGNLMQFLQHPTWSDLDATLAKLLRECPPLFLFLDALDEHFEHSPRVWLKCQQGLFCHTVQSLRSDAWNRLHLTVSLRDVVHASMMRSEHRSRFIGDSHIRILNWDRQAIEEFLQVKIERLHKRHFANFSKGQRSVDTWLGFTEIDNVKRSVKEPTLQYLLRHTRLLPRDMIIIGNRICNVVDRRDSLDRGIEGEIRNQIHEAASIFGREQFKICANEILSAYMPAGSGSKESRADDEYTSLMTEDLQDLVRSIAKDRFSRNELEKAGARWKEKFNCEVFSLLWRNGLIGYIDARYDRERFIFYNHDSLNSFELPGDYDEYVFHPIVIDATGINGDGPRPVIPYLEDLLQ